MGNYLTFTENDSDDLDPFIKRSSLANALADIDGDEAKVDAVNHDIDASEDEVNSYIGNKYTVPLTTVPTPPVVVDAAGVLTAERIFNRGKGPPQNTIDRAAQIRTWLGKIAAGKANIAGVPQSPSITVGPDVVIVESEPHQLTRTKLGFLTS